MQQRLNKFLVSKLTDYFRRIFRYNSQWTNLGVEIVQLSSGSEQLVFEQFFNENERYPVVTVGSNGGSITPFGFNDYVSSENESLKYFGQRNLAVAILSNESPITFSLPDTLLNETSKTLSITAAWTGIGSGGDDITATVYKNYTTNPVAVASGSIIGTTELSFQNLETELFPSVILDQQDYWVNLQTSSGSSYYVGIDNTKLTKYISRSGSVEASGSVVGFSRLPINLTYGGMYEGTITFRCMSKNQIAQAYDLSELIAQYLFLGKHATLSREATAIDGMELPIANYSNLLGTLAEAGINIKDVRVGSVENRRRGEKDLIFTVPITLTVMTEWSQQFNANYFKDITTTINTFLENLES
ncbi:MAG: hypothetical protein M0R17_02350 [Candidatus Omnitrophica bacterium]|jgi:hypothetical protein|nr:hypothetical protein [Candidatus Omnitrophota bacterium]